MLQLKTDSKVLGFLGRALSLELSAVQLYSTQSRLLDSWGLKEAAEKLSLESAEEMKHADRIIARMLASGVAPNASQLRPVHLENNLLGLLQYDYSFEIEIIGLYQAAVNHCTSIADNDNRIFFEALLKEEKEHSIELQSWIQSLSKPA